jgi:hypothetical protein
VPVRHLAHVRDLKNANSGEIYELLLVSQAPKNNASRS